MKHLRMDYEAIQPFPTKRPHNVRVDGQLVFIGDGDVETLGKHMDPIIPDDEPVFLIRAMDPVGAGVVHNWALQAQRAGSTQELVDAVHAWADYMEEYREDHRPPGGKVAPDTSPQLLRKPKDFIQ